MKCLLITRLYSGFELSLKNLVWNPEGVPTIYNLINKLSLTHDTSIIFTAKDSGKTYTSNWKKNKDVDLKIKNLDANIKVLSGVFYFPKIIPRKVAMILRDFRQLIKVIQYIQCNKPQLIYCDSANIIVGFILSKLYPNLPIVIRVLGVCSFWRSILKSKRFVHKIYKFAFKGHYSTVIGTQDGSGIEYWFNEVLKKNVSRYVLLNGVKNNKGIKKKVEQNKQILFVGRLEEYKGIIIFIKAIIKVLKSSQQRISIIIIGDGTLFKEVISLCEKSGFRKKFKFLKSIPHKNVLKYHLNTDIYVSANTDGNLINTNLEAISSDACMIIPKPQKEKLIDIKTYEFLKDSVLYYKVNDEDDLAKKIMFLLKSPDTIIYYKNKLAKYKKRFLRSWKERIDQEIKILEALVKK
ncbi:MAG: hypothetical protein CBC22_03840 [Alphaproteobacteria bacterium TMED62]|nr:MAG: hypothetical protein CBC22_03840 [Alphaproteobacteria bacterium TMED62]|tara:strand:- start:6637 stop:7860 length:1224 start_codon:yes stop_codon:yes gene_type:complete